MVAKRMLALAISMAYFAVQEIHDAIRRLRSRPGEPPPLVVLTYHAVPESDAGQFEAQMRDLKALADQVFADGTGGCANARRAAVTFDDGFQSVFDNALPIMANLDIPATLFVPTGYLAGAPGWIPAVRRQRGSSGIVASAATLASSNSRLVKIGSHTVTHPHLPSQPGDALQAELAGSKRELEEITGAPVTILSFPYGSFDDRVLEAASAAGYRRLFANVPVMPRSQDGAQLVGRINVSPRDWRVEFRLKVRGAYDWMAVAVTAKRAITASLKWAICA